MHLYTLTFDLTSVDRGSLSEKKLLFSKGQSRDGHLTVLLLPLKRCLLSPPSPTSTHILFQECLVIYTMKPFDWLLLPSAPPTECNNILSVSGLNASSFWEKNSPGLGTFWSSASSASSRDLQPWSAGGDDPSPWLELELRDRSSITGATVGISKAPIACLVFETHHSSFGFLGIVTTGTDNYYIHAFILFFSKDRKNWKLYKDAMSKEQKVNVGPRNLLMCSTLRKSTSRVYPLPGIND